MVDLSTLIQTVPEEEGKDFWLKRESSAATQGEGDSAQAGEMTLTNERRESG